MAARTAKPFHPLAVRERIKTTQLVKRLQAFALGEQGVEMTKGQVTAALGLLKKAVPDLQSVTLSGDDNSPIVIRWQSSSGA